MNPYLSFVPLALGLSSVSNALSQNATSHVERMRQVVHNYVDNKSFMGTVLVAEQDKVLLSEGYGYADLEWTIANSPATKFRIGSITKQFTAASVLLLQENGKLKLEEPVRTYLLDAPWKAWDRR